MKPPVPLFVSVDGAACLVVGGGPVAERKARLMLAGGAQVTVVAPEITAGLARLAEKDAITVRLRRFRPADIGNSFIVFAATDDGELNGRIAQRCIAKGVLVNAAKPGRAGNVTIPASVRRGGISVALSTAGGSPALAKTLAGAVAERLGPWNKLLSVVGPARRAMLTESNDSRYNIQFWRAFFSHPVLEWAEKGDTGRLRALMKTLASRQAGKRGGR